MTTFDFHVSAVRVLDELARLVGATAALWRYEVSHRVLEVRVEPDAGAATHILLTGCEYLSGPTSWKVAAFELSSGRKLVLEDRDGGFRVVARALELTTDVTSRMSVLK